MATEERTRPEAAEQDVVALLMQQHGDIRNLFDEVEASTGDARRDAFRRLVRFLAVHETAEEEVVHPLARRAIEGGEEVVAERLREENEAKQMLVRLEEMDPQAPEFATAFAALRVDVEAHARAEERYEFTQLRRVSEPGRLAALARAVKAAEATAPTRPHPGVESGAENVALGPLAAVADRARDAIRRAMGKDG
ncbi:hemerythrin domain-containing protein [Allostreptomyces psammosilenae]|uniref:Hemerythrin superfamily protein n=1 Tax=Allostreptomyces psammosilenae TaxID=1892865 RepID=A0A852ZSG4_9ACTN|nr:hemerythrin domain-containing protein [Allostreptomyces psammosilenae]NYI05279.1 hemerythrin superfamily protein [Allostreptomyces psammosilenae]